MKSGRGTERRRKKQEENCTHLLLNVDFFPFRGATADNRLLFLAETQPNGF